MYQFTHLITSIIYHLLNWKTRLIFLNYPTQPIALTRECPKFVKLFNKSITKVIIYRNFQDINFVNLLANLIYFNPFITFIMVIYQKYDIKIVF